MINNNVTLYRTGNYIQCLATYEMEKGLPGGSDSENLLAILETQVRRLNGCEFEQTPERVQDRGSLACCSL